MVRNIILFTLTALFVSSLGLAQKLETVVQRGHYEAVKTVAFTPDGKYLLTGSRDKSIKLWEVNTGRELRSFLGHQSTVNDIAVSSDGKFFISSSADKTAKMWNISTGELLKTFGGHTDYLTSVALSNNNKLLITAGFDWEAKLWDVPSGEMLKTFKVNPDKGLGYGISASFSPDDKKVAFGGDNRSVMIYDVASGEQLEEYKPEKGFCGGCATFITFKNDQEIFSASNKGDLKLWSTSGGKTLDTYYTNPSEFTSLDFFEDRLLITTEDSLKIYSAKSKKLLMAKNLELEKEVTDARFSPDGKTIAISCDDTLVRLYDASTGALIRTYQGFLNLTDKAGIEYDKSSWDYYIRKYTSLKNDVRISPDGQYLVKGKIGSIVRMWEVASGKITREFIGHEKAVLSTEFSNDGKYLLTAGADGKAILWDVATGKLIREFVGHRDVIFNVTFSTDQKSIATGSWDGTAKVWDLQSGELKQTLLFEQSAPYKLKFYNNDIYLLIAGLDKTLKLWEIDSKTEVRNFLGHTDIIHDFDIAPDNKMVASASWDGKVKFWDISNGLQAARMSDHEGPVYATTFSHDGMQVATAGLDRDIRIRNAVNGTVEKKLVGHVASVTSLEFSSDNAMLVSASEDGMVKVWDVTSGKELVSYIILNQKDWMAINANGYFNATEGAMQNISFVQGMQSFSVDQFFDEFYKPDLLKKTFNNRGGDQLNMIEKIEKSPPPTIEFISPPNNETSKTDKIDVFVKVSDAGGGVSSARLIHNGKIIMDKPVDVKSGKSIVLNEVVQLVPGTNYIEATAKSKGNIESKKYRVRVDFGEKMKSTLYLVVIGINQYENEALNLNYAAADAKGFKELIMSSSEKLYDKIELVTLYDYEATKDNIINKLTNLSKIIKPNDVLFFYYAGHGSMVDNEFYFVPTDNVKLYSEDKLSKNGITATEMQAQLTNIAALKQVVFIDACQSGGGVEMLAQRGAGEEKALAQLSRSTGIHILAAAGSEQFATEFTELGHGLFTHVLLEALSGKADGAPKDGKITIYELKSYLDDQVPEYSKKYKGAMQFPHTFSRGQDFPLVIE
ncbi:MAG: caspase family protein [Cyclobacteriaceae bacterium]|uniref:WD40 domain-containing protein n=1 Tax=Fulvivirga sp. TaxID=1931237 RepID=UPI0032EAF202